MNAHDTEIELLKAGVSCAALLERLPPVWRLDRVQSTRRSLKYRRGDGEIVIVNHNGRGWWDPLSDRKGDIFTLVQHLDPGLSFGEARRLLRGFVGIAPTFPEALRVRRTASGSVATFGHWPPVICERESTYLSGGNFEQCGDEFRLGLDVTTADVPNLPLPDHCHRLIACQRSSRRPEAAKAKSWTG
jgi:hypothetical protein